MNVETVSDRPERDGFEIYVPLIRRWTKPRRKRKPILSARPAFGPYWFMRAGIVPLRMPTKTRLLCLDGQYCEVADDEIARLQQREFLEDENIQAQRRKAIRVGSKVSAHSDLFGDIDGTLVANGGVMINPLKL
jgi:hypothetical protein